MLRELFEFSVGIGVVIITVVAVASIVEGVRVFITFVEGSCG